MSKTTEVYLQTIAAPAAANNTGVHAAITLPASGTTEVTTSITNPDVPRVARIKGNASGITGNVVIEGTDIFGQAVTDTIAAADATAVDGVVAFKTITKITVPQRTQGGDTISVGFGAALGLECYCDEHSFSIGSAKISSYAYDKTVISKNVATPTTSLNGSTNIGLGYIPYLFPAYGRTWG